MITGAAHNKLIIKSVENFTDIKVIAACLQEIDEKTYTKDVCVFDTKNIYETIKLHVLIRCNKYYARKKAHLTVCPILINNLLLK